MNFEALTTPAIAGLVTEAVAARIAPLHPMITADDLQVSLEPTYGPFIYVTGRTVELMFCFTPAALVEMVEAHLNDSQISTVTAALAA